MSDQRKETQAAERRTGLAYEAPRLQALGDLRQLTLGGSAGAGESGNERTREPF